MDVIRVCDYECDVCKFDEKDEYDFPCIQCCDGEFFEYKDFIEIWDS